MIAEGLLERLGRRGGARAPAPPYDHRRPPSAAVRRSSRRFRPNRRLLVAVVILLALLAGAWLWVRDSSFVAVQKVTVTGAEGPDAGQIRRALIEAARNMTTLDVNVGRLNTAVAPFPVVKSLQVSTQFPHGMRIHVVEQVPVATVSIGGRPVAVAGDGTLIHDNASVGPLPVIPLQSPPGSGRLSDPAALREVALLAAAPFQLLPRISQVSETPGHGLEVQLRNGPSVYFGDAGQLAEKWTAAVAVLADSHSAGAAYIDVSDPARPAAGAGTTATPTVPTTTASGNTTATGTATTATGTPTATTTTTGTPTATGTTTTPAP